jgi:hypothetical protein
MQNTTKSINMEVVDAFLRWAFTNVFYPAIIIGVFLFILVMLVKTIRDSDTARTLSGTLLPIVILVFIIISDTGETQSLANLLDNST